MTQKKFINLRNYTENSLSKSIIKVGDLVDKAKEYGLKSVALTDVTAYWMVQFYQKCLDKDIKPLFGMDFSYKYSESKPKKWEEKEKLENILLFPKSNKWKVNIFNIITDKNTWKINSVLDYWKWHEILEDVIFVIKYEDFRLNIDGYKEVLWEDNIYIELQPIFDIKHYYKELLYKYKIKENKDYVGMFSSFNLIEHIKEQKIDDIENIHLENIYQEYKNYIWYKNNKEIKNEIEKEISNIDVTNNEEEYLSLNKKLESVNKEIKTVEDSINEKKSIRSNEYLLSIVYIWWTYWFSLRNEVDKKIYYFQDINLDENISEFLNLFNFNKVIVNNEINDISLLWDNKIIEKVDFSYLNYQESIKIIDKKHIIITSPSLYLNKENGERLIKIAKTLNDGSMLSDVRKNFSNMHFKTYEDIRKDFEYIDDETFDLLMNNIDKIVDDIDFNLELYVPQIPKFEIEWEAKIIYDKYKWRNPNMTSDEWYIRYLTFEWFNHRYDIWLSEEEIQSFIDKNETEKLEKQLSEYLIPELKEKSKLHWTKSKIEYYEKSDDKFKELLDRTEYELFVMHNMGFDAYFLIVSDYINWSRANGDIVGPWRWSAAGSVVAYLTGITDLDPIHYELLFERFLNPARVSMPDVDTDFSDRDAVVKYSSKKYGEKYVTTVITFWKLTAKSVLKGVWKSLGVWFREMNNITSNITWKEQTGWVKLEVIYEQNDAFRSAVDSSNEYKNIYETSKHIEWLKEKTWQHACAVIIAPRPVTDFCPLQFPADKTWLVKEPWKMLTQLDGWDMEAQWLLKMDFLKLVNLTIMNDCLKLVKENYWKDINLSKIDFNDQKVYEKIFQTGNTTNVFQFESEWMKKHLMWLKPTNLDDLIVMVSLYRPWPIKFIPTYINRKHGVEKVEYAVPVLEKSMSKTYGICVYQEQIMQMAQDLAGYSLWEADLLRRAVWKKKKKVILEQRVIFIEKAAKLWYDEEVVGKIYDDMILPAAEYSFNKSHAACYAYIAYQGAYLKTYFPEEYNVACMMSAGEDLDRVDVTMKDALSQWINILPVNINESEVEYKIENNNKGEKCIRLWLKTIKWLWTKLLQDILDIRDTKWKFETFNDFIEKLKPILNKTSLEKLLLSGSLEDLFDLNTGIENVQNILKSLKSSKKQSEWQINMFDLFDEFGETDSNDEDWNTRYNINFCEIKKATKETINLDKYIAEINSNGIAVQSHPFDWMKSFIESFEHNRETLKWNKNTHFLENDKLEVELYGVLTDVYVKTNNQNEKTASLELLWTDYIIKWNISSRILHDLEHELVWKSEKNPVGINKVVKVTWRYSLTEYWRSLYISNVEVKDIYKMIKAAKQKNRYNEENKNEKCSFMDIYKYKYEKLDYIKIANIIIDKKLLSKDSQAELKSKMVKVKDYLQKHNDPNSPCLVLIKTPDWKSKETGMKISDTDWLINFIDKISWLRITGIRRTNW